MHLLEYFSQLLLKRRRVRRIYKVLKACRMPDQGAMPIDILARCKCAKNVFRRTYSALFVVYAPNPRLHLGLEYFRLSVLWGMFFLLL